MKRTDLNKQKIRDKLIDDPIHLGLRTRNASFYLTIEQDCPDDELKAVAKYIRKELDKLEGYHE